MPTHSSQATAEGLPEIENPWVKARRLARELSDVMAEIEESERPDHVVVFPDASRGLRYGFASKE